jgi:lactose/L-arabinose transport system ATP-binding protein
MSDLKLRGIKRRFGTFEALKGIDLNITHGEFVVFVGPSGCGKSTLLRIISGLDQADAGDIEVEGARVNDHTPFERGVAMVFQSYALYPHMTVAQNMGFPLKMANEKPAEIERKVRAAADVLQLGALLERKPDQLSGGQKQRVAMGRTIVRAPTLFLFDEPLSNLDADLRIEMRVEIEKLHRRLEATMIYVTHDQVEAMTLADRIVVLRAGTIEQVGPPLELYDAPVNMFVASFLGAPKINFLSVRLVSNSSASTIVELSDGTNVQLPIPSDGLAAGSLLTMGIRPEDLSPGEGDFRIPFEMDLQEQLGPTSYLYGKSGPDKIIAESRLRASLKSEAVRSLGAVSRRVHLFLPDGKSLRRIVGSEVSA